jgi:hypothetical protein
VIAVWSLLLTVGAVLLLWAAVATANGHRYLSWAVARADQVGYGMWLDRVIRTGDERERAEHRQARRARSAARGRHRAARLRGAR